ncbi:hypothetical protein DL93DRAFT_1972051 [Clavulina sp. PMI_390]|nr:hypothetical protein DL93DRAFT_1972051 [Clavulina sp. PMI_390]
MPLPLGLVEDALMFMVEMTLYYKCTEDPNPTLTADDRPSPSSARDRFVQRRANQAKYVYAAFSLADLYLGLSWDRASVPSADRARLRTLRRVGFAVLGLGSLFRIWAMESLGRFFTFQIAIRKNHKVIKSGPFGLVRHPSYTGVQIMILGEWLLMQTGNIGQRYLASSSRPSWATILISLLPVALSSVAILPRLAKEEKMLVDGLGAEYSRYQVEVPWKLIPGLI